MRLEGLSRGAAGTAQESRLFFDRTTPGRSVTNVSPISLRRTGRPSPKGPLTEQAGDQEGQLEAFVAVVERDKRSAEAAVSQTADELDEDEVRQLLAAPHNSNEARRALRLPSGS